MGNESKNKRYRENQERRCLLTVLTLQIHHVISHQFHLTLHNLQEWSNSCSATKANTIGDSARCRDGTMFVWPFLEILI